MRHIAGYLLCQIGGNANPTAEDVKAVLAAGGVEADDERLAKLISELEGKSIDQLIAEGAGKMSSVPSGGAAIGGGAASGGAAAAASGGAAEEEAPKEEEKKEEEKEESDDDMGFGLFD